MKLITCLVLLACFFVMYYVSCFFASIYNTGAHVHCVVTLGDLGHEYDSTHTTMGAKKWLPNVTIGGKKMGCQRTDLRPPPGLETTTFSSASRRDGCSGCVRPMLNSETPVRPGIYTAPEIPAAVLHRTIHALPNRLCIARIDCALPKIL